MPRRIKVGVIIPWTSTHNMRVAEGIAKEVEGIKSWQIRFAVTNEQANRLAAWRPEAIILNRGSKRWVKTFGDMGAAMVNYSGSVVEGNVPTVRVDDLAVGRIAAEHLLGRGLKHFAYWGTTKDYYSKRRFKGFAAALGEAGIRQCDIVHIHIGSGSDWKQSSDIQGRILQSLPQPLGMLAVTDQQAFFVSDIIQDEKLRIPDDIAIMGVDNDAMFCKMVSPQLTSVITPSYAIGRRAVRLLADILAGRVSKPEVVELSPCGVVSRGSTDMLAIHDPIVVAALRFIYANAGCNISVEQVRDAGLTSRRRLEQLFRAHLGRPPAEVIRQARLERIQFLLLSTKLTVREISDKCDFRAASYLISFFRRETGTTPLQFRKAADASG